jgi:hypothetical protein
MMLSHKEDVTLLNPVGSLAHGWDEVAETMERSSSQVSEGEIASVEALEKNVRDELALVVWEERIKAKVGTR